MSKPIENTHGLFRNVTDYSLGVDADGESVTPEVETSSYRANAVIAKGDCLMFVAPSATAAVSVAPMTAAADSSLFAGVALHSCAAGNAVLVARYGHCLVNVGADTVAAGDSLILPVSATGAFDTASDIQGVGTVWGVKNSANLAFAYIQMSGALPALGRASWIWDNISANSENRDDFEVAWAGDYTVPLIDALEDAYTTTLPSGWSLDEDIVLTADVLVVPAGIYVVSFRINLVVAAVTGGNFAAYDSDYLTFGTMPLMRRANSTFDAGCCGVVALPEEGHIVFNFSSDGAADGSATIVVAKVG